MILPPGARPSEKYVANIKNPCIHGRAYVFDRNVFQEIPSAIGDGRNAVLGRSCRGCLPCSPFLSCLRPGLECLPTEALFMAMLFPVSSITQALPQRMPFVRAFPHWYKTTIPNRIL